MAMARGMGMEGREWSSTRGWVDFDVRKARTAFFDFNGKCAYTDKF